MTTTTDQPSDSQTTLAFFVPGEVATQGSKRHLGNGIMVESSKKLPGWRSDIRGTALTAIENSSWTTTPKTTPVKAELQFYLARPKGHYRTGRNAHLLKDNAPPRPIQRFDIDKLARAVLDALTSAGVWTDDDQVVDLHPTKHYAEPGATSPGCSITITLL